MMPIPASLVFAILKYAVIVSVVVGSAWWVYDTIYDRGWNDREEIAIKDEAAAKLEHDLEYTAALRESEQEKIRQHQELMGVINAQAEQQNKLQSDFDRVANQRMYITTKAQRCDIETREDGDTGEPGSRTGRVELSESDAKNIRSDYYDAQRVVNQYINLREIVLRSGCFEVVE